jgi:hypothetical protein
VEDSADARDSLRLVLELSGHEVETAEDGLGPAFNGNSCGSCHAQPDLGGSSPNAAVPQEFLRKATAANVLGGLGALKGLGQIRVAEISLAKDASAAPPTSVPANKLLTEMAIRTHQRNSDIADLAQRYSEKNGGLDVGFDKVATAYGRLHPMFSDAEIKNWQKAIGESNRQAPQGASPRQFQSASDVQAAIASKQLKSGDPFLTSDGRTKYVP